MLKLQVQVLIPHGLKNAGQRILLVICFAGSGRVDGRDFAECQDRGPSCFWGVCRDCFQGSLWADRGSSSGKGLVGSLPCSAACVLCRLGEDQIPVGGVGELQISFLFVCFLGGRGDRHYKFSLRFQNCKNLSHDPFSIRGRKRQCCHAETPWGMFLALNCPGHFQ